ncbi:carbonic anhydrase [Malaciobacter pacificus]|uniref:Carbonic anhydrase n=1 Tax=Malaciobacter pacificus TaxID=1080223 RepID=A0A5C2H696_9BACT|nr:carbonic anhydrase family protein [Malaciobacter pacificus]QEP34343.1 alpha carbonic anhydrase [Malaciobacter pacificus]GGD38270.1 carbonic anhydrase [Malaciobacter pacificus]
MSQKNTIIAIFIVFVVALLLSEGEPKKLAHWDYSEDKGPKEWANLDERYNMCGEGKNQSPINITDSIDAELLPLRLKGESKAETFVNNGHSVQVNFNNGSYINISDKKYSLKQIHFHTPSENQIKGKSYPMEAHLVHTDSYDNIAVIAVMFEEGNNDNLTLNKLLRNLPEKYEDEIITENVKSIVTGYEILPENRDYYLYNGSLTTPPCNEGVKWFVLKNAVKISKSQLDDFTKVMPKNNRPIQEINARTILH